VSKLPIRILLISPRPEEKGVSYLDHRMSAKPLLAATEDLGDLIQVKILETPTFTALQAEINKAQDLGQPYDVLHFDGHGVFDKQRGLGALCFESGKPEEQAKLHGRAMELIHADKMKALLDKNRIPLVFLEACQSAQVASENPTASVAGSLLQAGVSSVVAMTHSVLVETAQRFTGAFYKALADGKRIGEAMLAGQQYLYFDDFRGEIMGKGELRMQDWFVPVLYQEKDDPHLIRKRVSQQSQTLKQKERLAYLGALPEPPPQTFIGRSRQLLALERLLLQKPWAAIRGQGGAGKTTLAVELCRWLVQTGRFKRCAFVSLEEYSDARGMLDHLGRQLVGEEYAVSLYGDDLQKALQPIKRALEDFPTLILLDNLESILPLDHAPDEAQQEALAEILAVCKQLLGTSKSKTRLLFTSREVLPAPFNLKGHYQELGRLSEREAIKLVEQVLRQEGIELPQTEKAETHAEIKALVEAANYHARALSLIARQLGATGLEGATQRIAEIMHALESAHTGERENSLFASVQLSLDRLPPEMQEQAKALAVFHGGAHVWVLSQVAEIEVEAAQALNGALIQVGLATDAGMGHLRLDPALPLWMKARLTEDQYQDYQSRWLVAMQELSDYLYDQKFKDTQLATDLTRLEVLNLLAMLQQMEGSAEARMDQINTVESLLEWLSLHGPMQTVIQLRKQIARDLGDWGHAYFLNQSKEIDRLLDRGETADARSLAIQLLKQFEQNANYAEANHDYATTLLRVGRIYQMGGRAELALPALQQALERFENQGQRGQGMAAALTKMGNCYTDLGQWEAAESAYTEAIKIGGDIDDKRGVAVSRGGLATLWYWQQKYDAALEAFQESLNAFQHMGEGRAEAQILHQIGLVYQSKQNWTAAEQTYRQSLEIAIHEKDRFGEAGSLGQLGNLYIDWDRFEEAANCYEKAAKIYTSLNDLRHEISTRSNLANLFVSMEIYDRARDEIKKAITIQERFEYVGKSWIRWDVLYKLEKAEGNQAAAKDAWQKA
ncbi:MAG: tetratricopeptide repeat protein, partial [Bacteroidota bacterium]